MLTEIFTSITQEQKLSLNDRKSKHVANVGFIFFTKNFERTNEKFTNNIQYM